MEYSPEQALKEIEDAFTRNKKRSKSWITVAGRYLEFYRQKNFERHYTAEDIVQELIQKILDGDRKWDAERVPNFDKFFYQNIKSIIHGKFSRRNVVESVESFVPEARNGKIYKGLTSGQYVEDRNPEEVIYIKDKMEECYKALNEDDEGGLVFLEWEEGKTSIEIAESLGIEVAEVEKIKKRIRYTIRSKIKYNRKEEGK